MAKYINEFAKRCIQDAIDNGDFEACEYTVKRGTSIRIDRVVVVFDGDRVYITLDDTVDQAYMILWNMDVGGILKRDFKRKDFEKYLELKTKNSMSLLRRIDDDELETFKANKMDHIYMGNFNYCIIKTIALNETYVCKSTYNDYIKDDTLEDESDCTSDCSDYNKDCNNKKYKLCSIVLIMEITYDILKLMSQEDKISLFTKLLSDTKRTGISNVIHVLDNTDFYVAPSSTRFHGNYAGGLLDHSLLVYALCENMFTVISKLKPGILSSIEHESIVISSLLHDVCKCGLYRQEVKRRLNPDNNQWESYVGYNINDRFPIGHGDKSVIMLQEWGTVYDSR